jgi:hypothetical protein
MGKTLEQHVSSIPLNIMEHVIADLLFIFRLQNLTQDLIVKANLLHMSPNVPNVCAVLYKIDVSF